MIYNNVTDDFLLFGGYVYQHSEINPVMFTDEVLICNMKEFVADVRSIYDKISIHGMANVSKSQPKTNHEC